MLPSTSQNIQFLLDGAVHVVPLLDPNVTVLTYLREHLGRRGTKEGCAEGDCGACTVVVAEPAADGLVYRPVNACIQFVAALDARELFTVESLSARDGALHPVQQAMVDFHGSQCGFCTPGIVMSLFALYKANVPITRAAVDDCLAGNLCRCTGYRPIIDAALAMRSDHKSNNDRDDVNDLPALRDTAQAESVAADLRLLSARAGPNIRFEGAGITGNQHVLDMPSHLQAALTLLAQDPDAVVVAGGTDVGLRITKQHQDLKRIVHVGRIPELRGIVVHAGVVDIGAATPIEDIYAAMRGTWPPLDELWRRFASPPIRHSATLGGNIANGSPIGDSMPTLLALNAQLLLASSAGERLMPLADFYTGYRKTALARGELIKRIRIPTLGAAESFQVYKVSKRFDQDISAVCGAFCLTQRAGVIETVRIAYGGMAATPMRARHCEIALTGSVINAVPGADAIDALARDFDPLSDARASEQYRRLLARNLLRRFFNFLNGAARVDVLSDD